MTKTLIKKTVISKCSSYNKLPRLPKPKRYFENLNHIMCIILTKAKIKYSTCTA